MSHNDVCSAGIRILHRQFLDGNKGRDVHSSVSRVDSFDPFDIKEMGGRSKTRVI